MRSVVAQLLVADFIYPICGLIVSGCAIEAVGYESSHESVVDTPDHLPKGRNAPMSLTQRERWLGTELGLQPDTWNDLGEIVVQTHFPDGHLKREFSPRSEPDPPAVDPRQHGDDNDIPELHFVGFDLTGKRAYRLIVKAENAKALTKLVKARGRREPNFGDLGAPESLGHPLARQLHLATPSDSPTWSDGVDNRTRRAVVDGYTSTS